VSVPVLVLYKSRLWDLGAVDMVAADMVGAVDMVVADMVAADLGAGVVLVAADLVVGAVLVRSDLVAGVLGRLVGVLDLEVLVSGLDLVVASLEDSVMVYAA
jgi:hypothetical protein